MTVLTVTLNAAVDVTYHVPRLVWNDANRVSAVTRRAGGKGVNVARVLHALGRDVIVTGFVGGPAGTTFRRDIASIGLEDAFVPIAGETRQTVVIVDGSGHEAATGFWEAGPAVTGGEWRQLCASFRRLVRDVEAVVLCGSIPPGAPRDAYAQLGTLARSARVAVSLDADGEALRFGLTARPAIVKPNAAELAHVAPGVAQEVGAALLRSLGADAVVVSCGAQGLMAITEDGGWSAAPVEAVTGNATGAGDAALAALVSGSLDGRPWPERIAEAVALSAASVLMPAAGEFDVVAFNNWRQRIHVKPIKADCGGPH